MTNGDDPRLLLPVFYKKEEQVDRAALKPKQAKEYWDRIVADLPNRLSHLYLIDPRLSAEGTVKAHERFLWAIEAVEPAVGLSVYPDRPGADLSLPTVNAVIYVGFYWCELLRQIAPNLTYNVCENKRISDFRQFVLHDSENPNVPSFQPRGSLYSLMWLLIDTKPRSELLKSRPVNVGYTRDKWMMDVFEIFHARVTKMTGRQWSESDQDYR